MIPRTSPPRPPSRKWVFISGPYRDKFPARINQNIQAAWKEAYLWWGKGYYVFCPHTNSAHMDGIVHDEAFLNAALEMVKFCDILVAIPGWRDSKGAYSEVLLAWKLSKDVWEKTAEGIYTLLEP